MHALLLSLAVALAPLPADWAPKAEAPAAAAPAPAPAPEPRPAAASEAAVLPSTAPAALPPSPSPSPSPALEAAAPAPPAPEAAPVPSLVTALPAASALAALAAIALLLSRRRGGAGRRLVQVVETASLGPKRQLVVARMDGQILLLGSSESGITLLASRPAAEAPQAPAETPAPAVDGERTTRWPAAVTRLFERRPKPPAPAEASAFESLLEERSEDLELRRKLASGLAGRVA